MHIVSLSATTVDSGVHELPMNDPRCELNTLQTADLIEESETFVRRNAAQVQWDSGVSEAHSSSAAS